MRVNTGLEKLWPLFNPGVPGGQACVDNYQVRTNGNTEQFAPTCGDSCFSLMTQVCKIPAG